MAGWAPMPSVMWFRRDLRLSDNPALLEAAADDVLPLFVLDPALWGPAGPSRRAYLAASLRALDASLRERGGRLSVVRGDPVRRVVLAAREVGAERVHVAADTGPYGRARDERVAAALADAGVRVEPLSANRLLAAPDDELVVYLSRPDTTELARAAAAFGRVFRAGPGGPHTAR